MVIIKDIMKFLNDSNIVFEYYGNKENKIDGICSISNQKDKCLTWIKNVYDFDLKKLNDSFDLTVVCNNTDIFDINNNLNWIMCDYPKKVFFMIIDRFFGSNKGQDGISDSAIIETRTIGENARIGANSYLCEDVIVGDNVCIKNNVSIECKCVIGNNVTIGSGTVIGTDGFGYYKDDKGFYCKVPHCGGVEIKDNVEIGANVCIDKGTIDDTIIGKNVKIDNLCHVGHNVIIEDNSLIIALSMLGGSSYIEKDAYIAPGSIIKNQVTIGEGSIVGIGAMVLDNVEGGVVMVGSPAKKLRNVNPKGEKL